MDSGRDLGQDLGHDTISRMPMAAPKRKQTTRNSTISTPCTSSDVGPVDGVLETLGPLLQLQSTLFLEAMQQGFDKQGLTPQGLTGVKPVVSSDSAHNGPDHSDD